MPLLLSASLIGSAGNSYPRRRAGDRTSAPRSTSGRRLTILALSLVVLCSTACSTVIRPVAPSVRSNPDANVFEVLTYNVFLRSPTLLFRDDHDRRVRAIPAAVVGHDVVVLQEAFSDRLRKSIIAALVDEYPYHTRTVGEGVALRQDGGVFILSRWPVEAEDQQVFDTCAQSDCLAAKGVIYARIDKLGRRYHVFGTHLQAGYADSDLDEIVEVRSRQLAAIRAMIDALAIPTEEPVLIAGDLNIDALDSGAPGSGGGEEYRRMLDTLNAAQPRPEPGPLHAPSLDHVTNSVTDDPYRQRLDHVLYSKGHAPPHRAWSRVLFLRDTQGLDLSDHHPVAARLEFTPSPP